MPANWNVQMSHIQWDWSAGLSTHCQQSNQQAELHQTRAIVYWVQSHWPHPAPDAMGMTIPWHPVPPATNIFIWEPWGKKAHQMAFQEQVRFVTERIVPMYVCVCVCMDVSVFVSVWVSVCVSMCLCVSICVATHMPVCFVCICVCLYMNVPICVSHCLCDLGVCPCFKLYIWIHLCLFVWTWGWQETGQPYPLGEGGGNSCSLGSREMLLP